VTADETTTATTGPGYPPLAWRLLVAGISNMMRILFRWKMHAHVEGVLPPSDGPAIVVVNHTGQIEPFLVSHAVWKRTGRWVRPLAKASLWDVPVLGYLGTKSGGIPVYRDSESGRGNAYSAAVECLDGGGTIYIAPEGTITHDGHLLPLRHGAARLALGSGAPIIVLTSFGGQRAWSPIVGWAHRSVRFDVHMESLHPIVDETAEELTGRMAAMMMDRSQQLQDAYPQRDVDASWWPPYKEPAQPSKTAATNLDQYREAMAEAVEHARERMAAMSLERDIENRVRSARERARQARANARIRAEELGEQMRNRADEMGELARKGELSSEMRHRAEELAHTARELAADIAEQLAASLHVDDALDDESLADESLADKPLADESGDAPSRLTVAEHRDAEHAGETG
jgi:1-acyl-sn-glycerol-3-phosphate acyltransferase